MDKDLLKKLTAEPGKKHKVADFDTNYTADLNKKEGKKLLKENVKTMAALQNMLYAHNMYLNGGASASSTVRIMKTCWWEEFIRRLSLEDKFRG